MLPFYSDEITNTCHDLNAGSEANQMLLYFSCRVLINVNGMTMIKCATTASNLSSNTDKLKFDMNNEYHFILSH